MQSRKKHQQFLSCWVGGGKTKDVQTTQFLLCFCIIDVMYAGIFALRRRELFPDDKMYLFREKLFEFGPFISRTKEAFDIRFFSMKS